MQSFIEKFCRWGKIAIKQHQIYIWIYQWNTWTLIVWPSLSYFDLNILTWNRKWLWFGLWSHKIYGNCVLFQFSTKHYFCCVTKRHIGGRPNGNNHGKDNQWSSSTSTRYAIWEPNVDMHPEIIWQEIHPSCITLFPAISQLHQPPKLVIKQDHQRWRYITVDIRNINGHMQWFEQRD